MSPEHPLKLVWFVVVFMGSAIGLIVVALTLLFYLNPETYQLPISPAPNPSIVFPQVPITTSTTNQNLPRQGLPLRLKIPSLKVDAVVENIGLTADGAMETPTRVTDVGWFKMGPRPGEKGSAVVAGHLNGNTWGRTGVFGKLHQLKAGDLVYIEDDQGVTISFTVWKTHIYGADERVPEVFVPADGIYLNLVTCEGVWDKAKQNYTQRLVVFTTAEKVLVGSNLK